MCGIALTVLGLALAADPIELPKDVIEIRTPFFVMPLQFEPEEKARIARVLLFVSEDQGKTWSEKGKYTTSDEKVRFAAPKDGLYWFALQVVDKDGKSNPANLDGLIPAMKVYVNGDRQTLKPQKTTEELQREVEELRKTVERLQKRIKELKPEHQN